MLHCVTEELQEFAKKVQALEPDSWILISMKHNPVQIKQTDEHLGKTNEIEVSFNVATNQWNVGTVVLFLEHVLLAIKQQFKEYYPD